MADCRRDGTLPWIRPDSKTQVNNKYNKTLFYILLKGNYGIST